MLTAFLIASIMDPCAGLRDAVSQSEGEFAESGTLAGIACEVGRHPIVPAKELSCKLHEGSNAAAATADYDVLSAKVEECLGPGWGIDGRENESYTERVFQQGRVIVRVRRDHRTPSQQVVWLKIWRILTPLGRPKPKEQPESTRTCPPRGQ